MDIAVDIAIDSTIWFFVVGNAAAAALGMLALASPGTVQRLSRRANTWVSSRKLGKPLSVEIHTENAVLRHPRISGSLVLLGGAFVLIAWGRLLLTTPAADGGAMVREMLGLDGVAPAVGEIAWLSFASVVLLGAALAIALGVLTLRHSNLLARVQAHTDRNVSTRAWSKPVETTHPGTELWISGHLRLWGAVVTALAAYVLINLIPALR